MERIKMAYIFPGQGAQRVGMGKDLYETFASAKAIFDEADEALGFSISRLCFEGPEEELRRTINTQPALFAVSLACLAAAQESGKLSSAEAAAFVAGHSLGEYCAVVAGGALSFADGVRLVRERGRLMQEAGDMAPGSMAAILGLEDEVVAEICQESGAEMANLNSPGQVVISGPVGEVEKAVELAQSRGARRVVPLAVSGAFHSRLMLPAAEGLAKAIAGMPFMDARIPLVANSTAKFLTKAEDIKEELVRQLTQAVCWRESVEQMVEAGVQRFIEFGPGQVLSGLVRRIRSEAETASIEDVASAKS